jgi:hypothetical protein
LQVKISRNLLENPIEYSNAQKELTALIARNQDAKKVVTWFKIQISLGLLIFLVNYIFALLRTLF